MDLSAGKSPYQPRLYRAEKQLAVPRTLICAIDILQYPLQLRRGKIRVYQKSCLFPEKVLKSSRFELVTELRRPPALPAAWYSVKAAL